MNDYPVLDRWPTPEEMPDWSQWAWSSDGWSPLGDDTIITEYVTAYENEMYRVGDELGDGWSVEHFEPGDTIQRIR